MKRILLAAAAALLCLSLSAQSGKIKYTFTEASDLTLTGKLFYDIPNPYHRVDTVKYKGFTKGENLQVRESSGIACVFSTNATTISVKTEYLTPTYPANTSGFSARGYDLYILDGGKWVFAASGVASDKNLNENKVLIKDMDGSWHKCLMYLPLYSEVKSVQIGINDNAEIKAEPNPFRGRVAIFGSSFTHGSSTSRAGMAYPAQFTRRTGIQMLSLGCSGNCKLQPYFCDVLCNVDADAFVFDGFSNPDAKMIKDRLFPFIEKLQAAQPGKPLIFQQTIRRESRNFSLAREEFEAAKQHMADSLMKVACKKYKDVYFIQTNATDPEHNASVDGTHPDNYGYTLWERSIEKPLVKILKKYGIK